MRKNKKPPYNTRLEEESWFRSWWRPAMAWSYLVICVFDFIGGPILNAVIAYMTDTTYHEWSPITLRGGGLYHMSMAAIVGLATWSRGIEKQIIFKGQEDNTDDTYDYSDRNRRLREQDRRDDEEADSNDPPDDNDSRHKGDDA